LGLAAGILPADDPVGGCFSVTAYATDLKASPEAQKLSPRHG